MTLLTLAYIVIVTALGGYVFVLCRRWYAVAGLVAIFFVTYFVGLELLGRPKPVELEWRHPDKTQIIAFSFNEPRSIYVWARLPGTSVPRAYTLPWSEKRAAELERLNRAVKSGHSGGVMMHLHSSSPSREKPMFYPEPQPALPPKQAYRTDSTAN